MCFSAEASLGVAVAFLPIGGYGVATAWRTNRAYLPFAITPILFGVQQLAEAGVWIGLGHADPALVRASSRWFLFFALAVWPIWVPFSVASIEWRGPRARACLAFAALGLMLAFVYYPPLADGEEWASARIVGHSIRYDFNAVPAVQLAPNWAWPLLYLAAVCGPMFVARDHRLWPLGVAIVVSAAIAYWAFRDAFASVWCFLAAVLSVYMAWVTHQIHAPEQPESRDD